MSDELKPCLDRLNNETPRLLMEKKEALMILNKVIDGLTEREAAVLRMRWMEGMTLEKVGIKIGRVKESVRRIEFNAIRKLRHPIRLKQLSELR